MASNFLSPGGEPIQEADLTLRRAQETLLALHGPGQIYAQLVECRKSAETEILVLDVDVELPQLRASDIRPEERLAVAFNRDDTITPEVLALRDDFPITQHQNLRSVERPRSICLHDRHWEEIRLSWTAPAFIADIRHWLSRAARDELHADDQSLELFLPSYGPWLVLPPLEAVSERAVAFTAFLPHPGSGVLVANPISCAGVSSDEDSYVGLLFRSPPQRHRPLSRVPHTLSDLADLLYTPEFDFINELRTALLSLTDNKLLLHKAILLIQLPKSRTTNGPVEEIEHIAVLLNDCSLLALGKSTGCWIIKDRSRGVLAIPDKSSTGQNVRVKILNICNALTRRQSARMNALDDTNDNRMVAIGAGALGSHVLMNLTRAGWGRWTVIDHDDLLPHNLCRHALGGLWIGHKKARALAQEMAFIHKDPDTAISVTANVLRPEPDESVISDAFAQANLIVDMSTSIAVARHLANLNIPTRCVSLFLSPSGLDLVLLAEDTHRQTRLDAIEMAYYALITKDPQLSGHLNLASPHTRYGLSCRDKSARIPQNAVATLAGIGSHALQQLENTPEATIRIWRITPDTFGVTPITLPMEPLLQHAFGDWKLYISPSLIRDTLTWRSERLPRETGGVLLGNIDQEHKKIFLLLAIPSPPDSDETTTGYTRGHRNLAPLIETIADQTAQSIGYIGEWHSHPTNASTTPSALDANLFEWIKEHTSTLGHPPVMLITGDNNECRMIVEQINQSVILTEPRVPS